MVLIRLILWPILLHWVIGTRQKKHLPLEDNWGKDYIVSTSTGGTVALKLAAEYPEIAGLILLSPNIAINDANAWMLNNHWGLQIAELIEGKQRKVDDTTAIYAQYWNYQYATQSLVQLEELIRKHHEGSHI
jgi:esterase/lipase